MTPIARHTSHRRRLANAGGCLLAAGWLLVGCASFKAQTPEGFAPLDRGTPFRAVTPAGVIYRVRELDNKPRADLTFWRKALRQRMEQAGYLFVSEKALEAARVPGYLLELAAPFGPQDFEYLVAVFVRGDELTVVEAAGEVSRVQARREAIVAAMQALRW